MNSISRLDGFSSLPTHLSKTGKNLLLNLSTENKKIALISVIALSILATIFVAYHYLTQRKVNPIKVDPKTGKPSLQPLPSTHFNPNLLSTSSSSSSSSSSSTSSISPISHSTATNANNNGIHTNFTSMSGNKPASPVINPQGNSKATGPFSSDQSGDPDDLSYASSSYVPSSFYTSSSYTPSSSYTSSSYTSSSYTSSSYTSSSSTSSTQQKTYLSLNTPESLGSFAELERIKDLIDGIENNLEAAEGDLAMQEKAMQEGFISDDEQPQAIEAIEKSKQQIQQYQATLKTHLADYLASFYIYLENTSEKAYGNIVVHTSLLERYMQTYKHDADFICSSLRQLDAFLTKIFFGNPDQMFVAETLKAKIIILHQFFTIVNDHIKTVNSQDPVLVRKIKVRLANFPLRGDREIYKNIFLTKKEQCSILIEHLQGQEDAYLNLVLASLAGGLSNEEIRQIAKSATNPTKPNKQSYLSELNRTKLQTALNDQICKNQRGITSYQLGKNPFLITDWNDGSTVLSSLKQGLAVNYHPGSHNPASAAKLLRRAGKAREFLEGQWVLPEEKMLIPFWYHATNAVNPIINSGEILVQHQGVYEGAWVSSQREESNRYGHGIFALDSGISKINPRQKVNIGFEYPTENKVWRGCMTPIPLRNKANNNSYVVYVGIDKGDPRFSKEKIRQELIKQGFTCPVFNFGQIDYIAEVVKNVLGRPNLSENWFGKADVEYLDH